MAKYIGRFIAPLALGAVVTLGACKADSSKQDTASALNRDTSALGRDLALANRGDTAAQPQLKDVPATPSAPARTTPRTTTRPATSTSRPATTTSRPTTTASGNTVTRPSAGAANSGGAVGTIAAGTTMSLTPTATVCTNP